jgi:hypothetical protein
MADSAVEAASNLIKAKPAESGAGKWRAGRRAKGGEKKGKGKNEGRRTGKRRGKRRKTRYLAVGLG